MPTRICRSLYQWVPSQLRRSHRLCQPRRGLTDQNATLTLTDDPPGTDHAVDAGNVSWTFAIPEPTVTHAIGQTLALSDFDDAGLDVEAAAVLVASAPGTAGNTLYADSDRGGSDTPLEGELGLGPDEVVISRIRHGAATVLSLNDNNNPASLALDDFFEGDGNGLTMYFQTEADGVVSFDVADQLSGNRNSATVRFSLPADAQTLLNNIPDGGRWIFALAQATPVAVDHEVDAGDVSWSFDIPEPTVTHTAAPTTMDHAVDAGNVAWSFDLPEPTVTHTSVLPQDHAVNAGNVSWSFNYSPANHHAYRSRCHRPRGQCWRRLLDLPSSPAQSDAFRTIFAGARLSPPRGLGRGRHLRECSCRRIRKPDSPAQGLQRT